MNLKRTLNIKLRYSFITEVCKRKILINESVHSNGVILVKFFLYGKKKNEFDLSKLMVENNARSGTMIRGKTNAMHRKSTQFL